MTGKIQMLTEQAKRRLWKKLIWELILSPLSRVFIPPEYRHWIIENGPLVDRIVADTPIPGSDDEERSCEIGAHRTRYRQMKAGSIWFELRLSQLWLFRWQEFRLMAYLLSALKAEETIKALEPEQDASRFKRWRCLQRKAWLLTLVYEYPEYFAPSDPDYWGDADASLMIALLRSIDSTQELWRMQRRMPSRLARELGRDFRRHRRLATRVAA